MTIQNIVKDPKLMQALFEKLRVMPPESKFKLPYRYSKKEREQELIDNLAEIYSIDKSRAHARVITETHIEYDSKDFRGANEKPIRVFNYALEVAIAPRRDLGQVHGGQIAIIGGINDSISVEGGESYFSGGKYEWFDKQGYSQGPVNGLRDILATCGFNTYKSMSQRRAPSVILVNLKSPCIEWLSSAGKAHIDLRPYAEDIAKTVYSLGYKMPSYRGQGFATYDKYFSTRDEDQIAQEYYLTFLRERYRAIQANPSLKDTDRITQSGVWYRVHKRMVLKGFQPQKDWGTTRESLTHRINEFCERLSREEWGRKVTREDLGIIASSRAIMHFNGQEYPVGKDNISALANAKTTDIIVIEKEGIADVLTDLADEYHIALVFTRGRFVNYVKDLIQEALDRKIPIKVWTLTDYDVDGMEIANAVDATKVPRIGIDKSAVEWLQNNGYPTLTVESVEEEHYAKDVENRTEDEYLWTRRIELDSVHSEIGAEGLWAYILHQIETISKEIGRSYIEIITRPHPSELLPDKINEIIDYLYDLTDGLVDSKYSEIEESELKDVKGKVLKVEDKKIEIRKKLKEIIAQSEKMDAAVGVLQALLEGGSLPEPKTDEKEDVRHVSKASLNRQKEQEEREQAESDLEEEGDQSNDQNPHVD
jgi:hypothetical protein